jgi:hypothetical protein
VTQAERICEDESLDMQNLSTIKKILEKSVVINQVVRVFVIIDHELDQDHKVHMIFTAFLKAHLKNSGQEIILGNFPRVLTIFKAAQ